MQKRLGLDLEVPDDFGIGLAWFSAGEAYFSARISIRPKTNSKSLVLRYGITLRADDQPLLEYIRDMLSVGNIYWTGRKKERNPESRYQVDNLADLHHVIIPLFEKYPLPSQCRKAKEFEIWKRLVQIKYHGEGPRGYGRGGGTMPRPQSFWDKVEPLVKQLRDLRKFKP